MIRNISDVLVTIGAIPELLLTIKATLALAAGLLLVALLRNSRASVRHLVLLSSFIALLALPLAMIAAPSFDVPLKAATTTVDRPNNPRIETAGSVEVQPVATTQQNAAKLPVRVLLQAVWLLGAAVFFGSFVVSLWRLRQLRRTSLPWLEGRDQLEVHARAAGINRYVDLLIHHQLSVPVTTGVIRPAILLPADARSWSADNLDRVLVHELEHINRLDWLAHVLARAVSSFYWFHPVVWMAWRKLSLEAELACDDAVVMKLERTDYAEQLLVFARRLSKALPPPLLSMANRSDLSTRVTAILNTNQLRGRVGGLVATLVLAFSVASSLAMAPLRAISAPLQQVQRQKATSAPQRSLNKALLEAIESKEMDDVVKLLDAGVDVNAAVAGDGSPLIVAAREGDIKTARLLLDRGADVNMPVSGDGNPLIAAASAGNVEVAKLLLDRGANIEQVVPGDENALIQASSEGETEMVRFLISRGADVNARVWVDEGPQRQEWRTPLNQARKAGRKEVVNILLAAGAKE
jgi:beta-lactamase regulating signal transducer with metallopeptidase domain